MRGRARARVSEWASAKATMCANATTRPIFYRVIIDVLIHASLNHPSCIQFNDTTNNKNKMMMCDV